MSSDIKELNIYFEDQIDIIRPLNDNLSSFLIGHRSHSSHGSNSSHGSHRSSSTGSRVLPKYSTPIIIPKIKKNDPLGQPSKPPNTFSNENKNEKLSQQEKRKRIIEQVQYKLKYDFYIYEGIVDGLLGPATRKSLKQYQKIRGIDITGKIDTNTLNALGIAGF